MLDELQLNITTTRYCENGNDFESIIDKLETPNFLGMFQSISHNCFHLLSNWCLKDGALSQSNKSLEVANQSESKLYETSQKLL